MMDIVLPPSGENCDASVDDLISLFARSLRALTPIFDEAGLGWREGEAYDQWDHVATSLFEALVGEPLAWACGRPDGISLKEYDMLEESLQARSFLVVRSGRLEPHVTHVLNRLATVKTAWDSLQAVAYDQEFTATDVSEILPLQDCEVALSLYIGPNQRQRLVRLSIPT